MAYGAILNQTQPYPTPAEIGAVSIPIDLRTVSLDLNNITEPGFYFCGGYGGSVTNTPTGLASAFALLVEKTDAYGVGVVQKITDYATCDVYVRSLLDATGNWSAWKKVATTDYAVAKTGDTMTGGLNFHPVGVTGYTQMYKNATSDSADYGTLVLDRDSTGKMIGLKLYSAAQKAKIVDSTSEYDIYYTGNKPTPADIGAATTTTYTTTIPTGWTASGNYYYKNVTVSGILATDNPIVDINPGTDNAANVLYSEAIGKVFRITTSANTLQLWATENITTAFPIQIKVVR